MSDIDELKEEIAKIWIEIHAIKERLEEDVCLADKKDESTPNKTF